MKLIARLKSDLLACTLLVVFWVLTVKDGFSRKVNTAIFPDNESMTNVLMSSMSRSIKMGSAPFWDSKLWGGLSLYNQPQLTPYYPFYFLKFGNFDGVLNSMRTIHLISLLHLLLFLLTTYFLLRVLKVSPAISIIGALIAVINSNTLGILSWVSAIATVTWIPTLIAGLVIIARDKKPIGFYIYFISVLLIVTAAPSHRLIFGFYLTIVFFLLYYLLLTKRDKKNFFRATFSRALLPTLIFLSIFIPILWPLYASSGTLLRWTGDLPPGYVIGNEKIPYNVFTQHQLSLGQLTEIIFQSDSPNNIGSVHIGIFALVLLIISMRFIERRHSIFLIFVFVGAYSVLSAFGSNLGLSLINYELPLLNKIREPLQFLTYWHLSVGVCISLGMQIALEKLKSTSGKQKDPSNRFKSRIKTLAQSNRFINSIVIIVFVAQFINTPWKMSMFESSTYINDQHEELNLVLDRVKEFDPESSFRLIFDDSMNTQLSGSLAAYKGIRTLRSYMNPVPLENFEYMYNYQTRGPRYLDVLGIKFAICKNCGEIFSGGDILYQSFEFIEEVGSYSIFKNDNAFQYASLLDSYQGVLQSKEGMASAFLNMEQGKKFALLDSQANNRGNLQFRKQAEECSLEIVKLSQNNLKFRSSCQSDSVLILNEKYSKDWQLLIDNKPVSSFPVNGVLLGAHIVSGSHDIYIKFYPVELRNSLFISGILWFVIIILIGRKKIIELNFRNSKLV